MIGVAALAAGVAVAGGSGETVHEVQLNGGVDRVLRADRMVGAVQHTGTAPTIELGWSSRGPRTAHVLELSIVPGRLSAGPSWSLTADGDTLGTGPDSAALVDLRYAVGRRVEAGAWTLHLGGTFANHFEQLTTNYAFLGVDTYLGVLGVGPWVDVRRTVRRRDTIELQAWTPVLTWIARNPYAVHSGQHIWNTRSNNVPTIVANFIADGRLATVDRYQSVHLRLGYALGLSDTWALVARGRVDALHLSFPHQLVEWQLGANLGIRGRF